MDPTTEPHQPDSDCRHGEWDHCYAHSVDENAADAYQICGECFHVFRTADELVAATAQRIAEVSVGVENPMSGPTDPEKIFACPHCAHDF